MNRYVLDVYMCVCVCVCVCMLDCQMVRSFMWTVIDSSTSSQLDEHVTHAQTLLFLVLHHPELCTELYCQLIKQTSKHPPQQKSAGMQVLFVFLVVLLVYRVYRALKLGLLLLLLLCCCWYRYCN